MWGNIIRLFQKPTNNIVIAKNRLIYTKMAGNFKEINDDSEFQLELTNAGTKLVVVDFFATWYVKMVGGVKISMIKVFLKITNSLNWD